MFPILRKRSKKLKERTSGSLVASRSSDLPAALSPGSSKKPVPLVHRSVRGLPISSPIPSPDSKRRNTSSPSSSGEYLSLFQDIRDEYSDATSASSHNPRGLLFTGMGVEDQRYDPPEGVRTDRESDEEECRPFPSPYRQYNVMSPINIPSLPDTESEYLSMEPCQSSYGSRSRESNQEKRSRQILQDISAAFRDSCHSASLDPSSDANARPKPTPKRTTGTSARGGYGILRWRDDNCEDLGVERLYVDIETPQGKKAIPIAYPPEFEHPFSAELENKLSHTGKSSPLLVHVSRARQTSSKPRKTLARISPRDNDLELYRKELDFLATVPSSPSRIAIRPIGIVPPSKRQILLGCSDLPDELNWEVIQRNHIRINLRETKKNWFAGSVLGEGTFGRVYLTYNVPNRLELAMKIVYIKRPLPKIVCQGLVNELKVLERLSRRDPEEVAPFVMIPNMVTGLWSWQSSEGFLHIITDFCPGGDLYEYKGLVSNHSLMLIVAEVILGLQYLHDLGIVHHDLKPENVLIDSEGHCILADYGGSKFLSEGTLVRKAKDDVVCTLPYAAPELLSEVSGKYKVYTKAVDYWALGAMIYTLVAGHELFHGDTADVKKKHNKVYATLAPSMEFWDCPEDLIDLTANLLVIDSSDRLGNDIRDITNHPYFVDLDGRWNDLRNRKIMPPFRSIRHTGGSARGFNPNCKQWPSYAPEHEGGPKVTLLENVLRKEGLELPIDESFDVLREHRNIVDF